MINVITAGRFSGKRIKVRREVAYITFGREHLDITHEIVDHIRLISVTQNRSFLSGFIRGFFARWLGNTAWLSAIQSSKGNNHYRIRIVYRDGTASSCIINCRVLDPLVVHFDFL